MPDPQPPSRIATIVAQASDLVRILQFVAVIFIAVLVYMDDRHTVPDTGCKGAGAVGILAALATHGLPAELADNIKAYLNRCEKDADARHIAEVAAAAASATRPSGAQGARVVLGGFEDFMVPPSTPDAGATKPTVTRPSPGAGPTAPSGWVAVGFVDGDVSFDFPPGRSLATLAKGDAITAKQNVNLRKDAADWNNPLGVVASGRSVTLTGAPRTLTAGSLKQVWAPVRLD